MSKKKQLQNRLDNLFSDLQSNEDLPIPEAASFALPSWQWYADADKTYTRVTAEVTDCLGINNQNFTTKSIFSYAITPRSAERLHEVFEKGFFPAEIDLYFQSAEGVFVPTHFQILQSSAQNGDLPGYHGFAQVLSENFVEPLISSISLQSSNADPDSKSSSYPQHRIQTGALPPLDFGSTGGLDIHHSTRPTTEAGQIALDKNELVAQPAAFDKPAVIAIPVNLQQQGLGVLELIDHDPNRVWTEDDYILVEDVAQQLSLAIENAQLYNAAQTELSQRVKAQQEILDLNKDLASLNEFGQQLNKLTEAEDIFKLTKEMIDSIVQYDKLTIALINQKTKRISFPIIFDEGKFINQPETDYNNQLPEEIFEALRPVYIPENVEDKLGDYGLYLLDKTPESYLAIPVEIGEFVKGAIIVMDYTKKDAFSETEIDLLSTMAVQTSSALENANLFDEIRSALSTIEQRENYQSNVAQAVATLTKFGSNALREVFEFLGTASNAERIFYAQIREESVSPYWHQTVEWISPSIRSSLRPHPVNNVPFDLFKDWVDQLREMGWALIHTESTKDENLRNWLQSRETKSIMLMAVQGKASTPSFIGFESTTATREWRNEEIGFLRVAADALSNTYIREDLVDQLQVSLDETENLYNASHQLSLANSYDEMLKSITHGLFIPDINRGILVLFENNDQNEVSHIQVFANWHNGNGTPPPPIDAEYDIEIYKDIFTPQMPTYYDDIYNAGLSKNMTEIFKNQAIRSMAVLPLWSGSRRIGSILLQSENRHTFTNREKRTFPPLIDQMATTVENLRLFGQTQEALSETEVLYKISDGISMAKSTQDLVDLISQNIMPASADRVLLMMVRGAGADNKPTALEIVGYFNKVTRQFSQQTLFPIEVFPALQNLRHQERIYVEDVARSNLDEVSKSTLQNMSIGGGVIIPLYTGETLVGLLAAMSTRKFTITADEYRLLRIAANSIAVAVERQHLLENTQQRALELQTAAEIARDTTSTLSLDELLSSIVRLISDRFDFYHTAIYLVDAEQQNIVIHEGSGEVGEKFKRDAVSYKIGSKNVLGSVSALGQTITVSDVLQDPLFIRSELLPETQSEIGLPLKAGNRVIGVLDIHSTKPNAFNQAEIAVLQILADQIAVAIENARAYEVSQAAYEDLAEVDRIKSQFLANMSHELRTPLNSIIGFSRVILKGIDGPINDTQEQDLNAIYNSGQHLLRLINDILDLSKIEAGKMQLQMAETNIADLVNSVMSTAIGLVKDKDVKLDYVIPDGLPIVMADQTRIRQVLLNFLSNAAKFTDHGSITTEVTESFAPNGGKELLITVTDTGAGIAEKDRVKLFQPFSQVDDSPTRKTGGTGLGLSICRSFIEMHNGRIGLLSSEIGVGSTFFFTIPIETNEEKEINEAPATEEIEYTEKTVLTIDDDKQITNLYERFLSNNGYAVVALNESKKAVEFAKKVKPFAITLDIMMPGRDGWHIIQDLKQDPETKNIPVIICSILEEEEKGYNLGATDYLIKPFLQEDLLNAINRLNFDGQINKILIIDDDLDDQRLIEKILKDQRNFDLTFANDGDAGITMMAMQTPDAVILDLMMPGKDGFDVIDEINSNEKFAHIPVIILTGADLTPEQYNRIHQSGQQLLMKGLLGEKELLTTLENTLRLGSD